MSPARLFEIQPRPLPFERVVKWLPLDDSYYLLASTSGEAAAEPVVIAQDALLQVELDLRSTEHRDAFGILCGAVCVCPDSGLQYVLVEGTMDARGVAMGGDPYAAMAAELSALARTAERSGKLVVGWYRTGATLFPRTALQDVAVHRALFPHPWQLALLRDTIGPQNRGAILRVEPTEGRPYSVPFYELLPPPPKHGAGVTGASVTWSNYRAELEVTPLPDAMFTGRRAPLLPLLPAPAAGASPGAPGANRSADSTAIARLATEAPSAAAPAPDASTTSAGTPPAPIDPIFSDAARAGKACASEARANEAPSAARPLDTDVALLFAPVMLSADGVTSDADDAIRAATEEPLRRTQPAYVYHIPFWRRRSVRYRTFVVLFIATAVAGAIRVRAIRTQQALERGAEIAIRTAPAPAATPGAQRLASTAAAGEVTGASREAAARFAFTTIEQASAALGVVLADIDTALADARNPQTHAAGCARADSAYVKALVNADAIALARRQLTQPLDSAPLARVQALTQRADDVALRLRAACR